MTKKAHSFRIDVLANRLKQACPQVVFALLHGSAVDGIVAQNSDVDIALYLNGDLDLATYDKILYLCQEVTKCEQIDLGVLNQADVVYCFEVLGGKVLFSRDQDRYLHFFSLTAREYESQLRSYERQINYRKRTKNNVIAREFSILDTYVSELSVALDSISLEEFENSWGLQRICERSLQVMIEVIIDVSDRLVALEMRGPCSSAREVIEELVNLGILKSADPYAKMVGFRNVIVHRYDAVNPSLLYEFATTRMQDFQRFKEEVLQHQ